MKLKKFIIPTIVALVSFALCLLFINKNNNNKPTEKTEAEDTYVTENGFDTKVPTNPKEIQPKEINSTLSVTGDWLLTESYNTTMAISRVAIEGADATVAFIPYDENKKMTLDAENEKNLDSDSSEKTNANSEAEEVIPQKNVFAMDGDIVEKNSINQETSFLVDKETGKPIDEKLTEEEPMEESTATEQPVEEITTESTSESNAKSIVNYAEMPLSELLTLMKDSIYDTFSNGILETLEDFDIIAGEQVTVNGIPAIEFTFDVKAKFGNEYSATGICYLDGTSEGREQPIPVAVVLMEKTKDSNNEKYVVTEEDATFVQTSFKEMLHTLKNTSIEDAPVEGNKTDSAPNDEQAENAKSDFEISE